MGWREHNDDDGATRALVASTHDVERFNDVVTACMSPVYGYLVLRVGLGPAEDLAAETFATVFRLRHRFDPRQASARAWIFGIATNLLRGYCRTERRRLNALARGELEFQPSFVDDLVEHVDASRRLVSVVRDLAALPADQRNALYLVVAGLSFKEAATVLKVPPGTVQSRVARARSRLHDAVPGPTSRMSRPSVPKTLEGGRSVDGQ